MKQAVPGGQAAPDGRRLGEGSPSNRRKSRNKSKYVRLRIGTVVDRTFWHRGFTAEQSQSKLWTVLNPG